MTSSTIASSSVASLFWMRLSCCAKSAGVFSGWSIIFSKMVAEAVALMSPASVIFTKAAMFSESEYKSATLQTFSFANFIPVCVSRLQRRLGSAPAFTVWSKNSAVARSEVKTAAS